VADRLGHLFPDVCGRAAYNRRLRRAAPLVAEVLHTLAVRSPSWGTPGGCWTPPRPRAASRQTVRRSVLAGWAGYGLDRSYSRWYWGLQLCLLAGPDGLPVAWCLANPSLGEREVAEDLLDRAARRRTLRPDMIILADKGLAGRTFEQFVGALGACWSDRPGLGCDPDAQARVGGGPASAQRIWSPTGATATRAAGGGCRGGGGRPHHP
jgi:hypothetical protein